MPSGDVAREIVDKHLDLCLYAGVNHEGINAEVAKGQWEFQIFGKGSKRAADDVWVARYLMARLGETYGVDLELHCKPIRGDWNGSGMHCNFSTKYMREVGGKEYFEKLMAAFEKYRNEHIAVYGPDNHLRLDRICTRRSQSTSLTMGSEIEALPSAFPTVSSIVATRDTSKIAVRTRPATPIRSQAGSFRRSLRYRLS